MDNKKLISELSSYMKTKLLKNAKVEADIGLPKNSLSNFLSLKKKLPKKWYQPIIDYINGSKRNDINLEVERKLILGELSDKVTTADKIPNPEPKSFANGGTMPDQINLDNKKESWVKEIEKYCSDEGILPEDLIFSHKERNKPKKGKGGSDVSKNEEKPKSSTNNESASNSHWFSDYRKKKLGL